MRYIIIFSITIILALLIIFYNPNAKYLGIYSNEVNIEYNDIQEGYNWIYESNDSVFDIVKKENSKWTLTPNKNGSCIITFYYTNDNSKKNSMYEIMYKFDVKNDKIYWVEGEGKGLFDYPNPY